MSRDPSDWIKALRKSHHGLSSVARSLDADTMRRASYAPEWSIAQVYGHLGSAAEIFELFLTAGLHAEAAPRQEQFVAIWDRWNAMSPEAQVTDSLLANESFIELLETLDDHALHDLRFAMFGLDLDVRGMASMRFAEHAVHSWDVMVALDPSATLAADVVELVIDTLPDVATQAGKPQPRPIRVAISTYEPRREFLLVVDGGVTLRPAPVPERGEASGFSIPGEAFVRLIYGRLDPAHTPSVGVGAEIAELRPIFPGF